MPVTEGLAWLERLLQAEPENRTLDANLSGFVTTLEAMSGRFDEARRHINESRALARDLGLIWQASVQDLYSGYIELLAGDPASAERDMRAAADGFREIGEGWFLTVAMLDLLRAVYEQGRHEDAFTLLETIDETPAPDREWLIKRRGSPLGCSPGGGGSRRPRRSPVRESPSPRTASSSSRMRMSSWTWRRCWSSPTGRRRHAGRPLRQ
jgi:hypothetical protein